MHIVRSPRETQFQIGQALRQNWWLFLLGETASYPDIVRDIIRRYYPQDADPTTYKREWVIQTSASLLDGYLHVVALDRQFVTFEQVLARMRNSEDYYADSDDAAHATDKQNVFVPVRGANPDALTKVCAKLSERFAAFLKVDFPIPPITYEPEVHDRCPVIYPAVVATNVGMPELFHLTPWLVTPASGRPATHIRFSSWLTPTGQRIIGHVIAEYRTPANTVTGEKLHTIDDMIPGPDCRQQVQDALQRLVDEALRVVKTEQQEDPYVPPSPGT